MSRLFAIVLVVLLSFPGCAVRSLSLNGTPVVAKTSPPQDTPRAYAETIAAGSPVRVELSDGRRLKGTFMGLEGDAIVLKVKSRVPEPPIAIPLADVESLEIDTGRMNWGTLAGISAAIGVVLFLVLVSGTS